MVNVNVSIDLLKLVDIDEEDYSIKIQFSIYPGLACEESNLSKSEKETMAECLDTGRH